LLQCCIRAGIAPRHLQVERDKTIPGIAHEQDDFRSSKFSLWNQVFAAQAVPPIAFRPVLKTIVREYYPGKSWLIVPPRLQGKLKTVTLA
jgi:hypothetical protein